jgi:OmcA/MtrC family decaheme c-type cytochrome
MKSGSLFSGEKEANEQARTERRCVRITDQEMETAQGREALNHPKEGTMSRRKWITLLAALTLVAPLMFYGCSGDDGATGAKGDKGDPGDPGLGASAGINLESCAICHDDQNVRNGDAHQADYDQRFQDNVVAVTPGSMTYAYIARATDNAHTVSFILTRKNDVTGIAEPFDCTQIKTGAPADSLSIGFGEYDNATGSFNRPASIPDTRTLSLGSQTTLSYDAVTNVCTSTVSDNIVFSGDNTVYHVGDLSTKNGIIEINGRDDRQGTLPSPSRVQLALYPFAGLLETGPAGVDYASAATVSGCEKCHTVPYLKHGFIYGRVGGDPATDFYTCKGCHQDDVAGGHLIWQLLVDDPQLAAEYVAAGETGLTPEQEAQYAYKRSLMNDVHMSHAMEFAYPQSMSNCVTCHEGKLADVLTDNNFVIETCKSCHPVTGGTDSPALLDNGSIRLVNGQPVFAFDTRDLALSNILPPSGGAAHAPPFATACNVCHSAGGSVPGTRFSTIHTGYDKLIYTDNGVKYSSEIKVTIDNASFVDNTNTLTFGFSATGSAGGVSSQNIIPTVLVGLYGFDTKDYLFGPHESEGDPSKRLLEFSTATPAPSNNSTRITVTGGAGTWNVTADLSTWAGWIDNGSVKRVEVAVMPKLLNPADDNAIVALDARSRTFNLVTKAFEDNFFGNSIVRVQGGDVNGVVSGCNNCHEALATTFHSPDRGGNVVVCRLCHITKSAGSHLELQSRSIDSYAHAIHRFQAFDTEGIDFDDPVEALHYTHHVESNFPTFGIENCRACHNAGKFNVPNQGLSLPGVLSVADFGTIRNIQPTDNNTITGPATRACGACHRAEAIIANEGFGDPIKLANINSHMTTFGYMIEDSRPSKILDVIVQIFSMLGQPEVDVTP